MVATRGKKIKFDMDTSEAESEAEMDIERPAKPASNRRNTKKSKSGEDDRAFARRSSPVKKKGKTTLVQNQLITQRSGRGGKLRDLMNMPVDIFTEICSYLDPYDLRRLALSSKRLWDILMTKTMRQMWKTALDSVSDLPECPTDLNEPQYVCLLYSSECYTIDCTSRGTKADWFHRVRFCSNCYESKMAGGWSQSQSQRSLRELGIEEGTLFRIQDYFNSRRLMRSYSFPRGYHIEALKKAASEYESLSEEEVEQYLSTLKTKRDYKMETGRAMMKWKDSQLSSRATEIEAEKDARFKSIETKLIELGWERRDFPMDKKEFKDLVLKDQKLTPKGQSRKSRKTTPTHETTPLSIAVWQNIKGKLELHLEDSRNERLKSEKIQRRRNREGAIRKFYHGIAQEVTRLRFQDAMGDSILPEFEDVLTLPSVKPLLESDTETVTEEQWHEAAPHVRYIILKWWRDTLEQLVDRWEHGTTARPNESHNESGTAVNLDSENDTEEVILSSIEAFSTKLSYATGAFRCIFHWCKKMYWFPDNLNHGLSCHKCSSVSELLNQTQPLGSDVQNLVQRLLADLKLDPETIRSSEFVFEDQEQKNFLCTRCDERVAKYMDLSDLTTHYLDNQKWFKDATAVVQTSPDACYPQRAANSELPKIVDDHDWVSGSALLARRDGEATKDAVLKLQRDFRRIDPTDDHARRDRGLTNALVAL
ncbi:hypothetical protein FRC01_011443 [Tulasnella sp. 417]|nr:hypothetical protein FRC01_011443 [Tulasnella sp. 417]